MVAFGVFSFLFGLMFYHLGAIPVAGFFGLDMLLLYLAFRWSFRGARVSTDVQVSTTNVTLLHDDGAGGGRRAVIPTGFARIVLEQPKRAPNVLRIEYGRRGWVIGRFLTDGERSDLATALKTAIAHARSERFASH